MLSTKQSFYICNAAFHYIYNADQYLPVRLQTKLWTLWSNYVRLVSLKVLLLDRVSLYIQADLKLGIVQIHISPLQMLRVCSAPVHQLQVKVGFPTAAFGCFSKGKHEISIFLLTPQREEATEEARLDWVLPHLNPVHLVQKGKGADTCHCLHSQVERW